MSGRGILNHLNPVTMRLRPRKGSKLSSKSTLLSLWSLFFLCIFAAFRFRDLFPNSNGVGSIFPTTAFNISSSRRFWKISEQSESARYSPFVLDTCAETMPGYYAPCLALHASPPDATENSKSSHRKSPVFKGEEVIYPDVSIPFPSFLDEESEQLWLKKAVTYAPQRFYLRRDLKRALYLSQHGQNLYFANSAFVGTPRTDVWLNSSCLSGKTEVAHDGFVPAPSEGVDWHGVAILANVPDSWSFQHFLVRTMKIMVQTEYIRAMYKEDVKVLTGRLPRDKILYHLWNITLEQNGGYEHVVHSPKRFSAGQLVMPCRCPLHHPYLALRAAEILGVDRTSYPLEQRKVVLYLSRTSKTRRVLNEPLVLEAIREVLKQRGKGEELVIFDSNNFDSFESLRDWISKNVVAVVGPHGGAFFNILFASPETFILEILPTNRFATVFWEESQMLNFRYAVYLSESINQNHDMKPDPTAIAELLQKHLSLPSRLQPEPRIHYQWNFPEVQ